MYAYTRLRNGSVKLTKDQVLDMLQAVADADHLHDVQDCIAYISGWLGDENDQEWQRKALDIAIKRGPATR